MPEPTELSLSKILSPAATTFTRRKSMCHLCVTYESRQIYPVLGIIRGAYRILSDLRHSYTSKPNDFGNCTSTLCSISRAKIQLRDRSERIRQCSYSNLKTMERRFEGLMRRKSTLLNTVAKKVTGSVCSGWTRPPSSIPKLRLKHHSSEAVAERCELKQKPTSS